MKFDKTRATEAVLNLVFKDRQCCEEYTQRMVWGYYPSIVNHKHVEAHKKVFGPQSYCWNGEYRFWVWDFGTWRVYVSDKQGASIEVNQGTSLQGAMDILRTYWAKFDI